MHHFHLGFWGFFHPRVNPVFIHSIDNASIVLRCWWDQSSTPTNHKTSSLAAHGIAHVFVSFLVACGRLAKNGHVSNQEGSIWVIQGTNKPILVPTNLFHIAVGPGIDTWDRKAKRNIFKEIHHHVGANNQMFQTRTDNRNEAIRNI